MLFEKRLPPGLRGRRHCRRSADPKERYGAVSVFSSIKISDMFLARGSPGYYFSPLASRRVWYTEIPAGPGYYGGRGEAMHEV